MNNKEISSYLIWVAANLLILLGFGRLKLQDSDFYPFSRGFEYIEDYDISEFLVYTIIPLLVILAIKLSKKN